MLFFVGTKGSYPKDREMHKKNAKNQGEETKNTIEIDDNIKNPID